MSKRRRHPKNLRRRNPQIQINKWCASSKIPVDQTGIFTFSSCKKDKFVLLGNPFFPSYFHSFCRVFLFVDLLYCCQNTKALALCQRFPGSLLPAGVFEDFDVNFLHFHQRLKCFYVMRAVRPDHERINIGRHDLPAEAIFILEPAALL